MSNYSLVTTLGLGAFLAFFLFFVFYKVLHWNGKMSALATAACMLLVYVPLSITHWVGIDVFAIHFAIFMMIPYGLGIITGVHAERRELEGEDSLKKGFHWIPSLIVVFFIFIALVDAVYITFSANLEGPIADWFLPRPKGEDVGKHVSSQFTGTVANDLQDEEVKFDKYVDKLAMQRKRGWKITGGWDNKPPLLNRVDTFRLTAKDKQGNSITGASVMINFRRSAAMKADKHFELKETGKGVYSAPIALDLPGCWNVRILVKKGEDEHETKGETEIATMVDGKLVLPQCIDGEPDL